MRNAIMIMTVAALIGCVPMVYAGTVTTGTFTGGDVGEGLDLEGTFIYAIDAGWDGTPDMGGGTIGDVTFTENTTPGSVLGGNLEMEFSPSLEYGNTANDDTLEGIIGKRIKAPGSGSSVSFELGLDGGPQLIEGNDYKLQLGFGHSADDYGYEMCWDIIQWHGEAGTVLLKDNMLVPTDTNTGHVLTYEFTATSVEADYLRIYVQPGTTHGDAPPSGWDGRYPGLNMITLESISQGSIVPGDANLDGYVDVSDLGILATNYGTTSGAEWGDADFTGEGAVDVSDLGILATNYGTTPPQAVPEPSAIVLLIGLVALAALARVRR